MIRVFLVDRSAVARKVLKEGLSRNRDLEFVGSAVNCQVAADRLAKLCPDVIVLDIAMMEDDAYSFLERTLAAAGPPMVIASSRSVLGEAGAAKLLERGAAAVVCKPDSSSEAASVCDELAAAIRAAANILRPRREPRASPPLLSPTPAAQDRSSLLAIGASTGGPQAIEIVLRELDADIPPTVIVQHMPPGFTARFAERLNSVCPMEVREAVEGEPLGSGQVRVAPGNWHLRVERQKGRLVTHLSDASPVHHQRPSVDVLFQSVAKIAKKHTIGVLLTGMGADGARGLLAIRQAGAFTIAQDEKSSVVYGMPMEAAKLDAACRIAPLALIPHLILTAIRGQALEPQT